MSNSWRELIKGILRGANGYRISWSVDPYEGLDFKMDAEHVKNPEQFAINDAAFGLQYVYLKSLLEQSLARRNANGFNVPTELVPSLDDDFCSLFDLPPLYPGKFKARFSGNTGQAVFSIALDAVLPDAAIVHDIRLSGPFLRFGEHELYRLTPSAYQALHAVQSHQSLDSSRRSEYENNWAILQLQLAKRAGVEIDLAHFNNLQIELPGKVGIAVEQLPTGDFELTPVFGEGISLEDIKARLGQLDNTEDACILRVRNRFVLLDQERLKAAHEILTNRVIPRQQIKSFLKSPTAYLDGALFDFDTGFSMRVHGAQKFVHLYFGDVEKSGVDWFHLSSAPELSFSAIAKAVHSLDSLDEVVQLVEDARSSGAQTIAYDGFSYGIEESQDVDRVLARIRDELIDWRNDEKETNEKGTENPDASSTAVIAIDPNDDEEEFVVPVTLTSANINLQEFSIENLIRQPFPHQADGIRWLLAHLSLDASESSGALLADDMGLGKTYMTLVGMAEWLSRMKNSSSRDLRPSLIVAPLTLMDNWIEEIQKTFRASPFRDIVILQPGAELPRYKVSGAGRETRQELDEDGLITDAEKIRYSLKIGKIYGNERLDAPNRLVLTTYQTLRDYQFSLSRVDWEFVVFDEAQNIKNPNSLVSRAAKGLKARFKLLATGTPVENSLRDFWCLMDCAVPGLLGAWKGFREQYISPIVSADSAQINLVKLEVGKQLRERAGWYMLRRTKADHLEGLPQKRIFTGNPANVEGYLAHIGGSMTGEQLEAYDRIVINVKQSNIEDKRKLVLPSLQKLRVISIHQDIERCSVALLKDPKLLGRARASVKISAVLKVLQEIRERKEKVLIFAMTKSVQALIATVVASEFNIQVDIVNGDTKAVASPKDNATRKSIIDDFQSREGFGVLVMSPIAAGVGLTIVGANNVIHLERHWNPAKEAQATDRVYRIGQQRAVNVYLPMALHPTGSSFDLQLDALLSRKLDLSEAVVAVGEVEADDFAGIF